MSSDMDMSDLLGIFLEEAEEQLQRLDTGILQLEKEPGSIEVLKEIFRAAHTLKGSSSTLGLTAMANLTHAMENLLDLLRSGVKEANQEIIDLLLDGTDKLRTFVTQISNGEELQADLDDLLKGLKAACSSENVTAVNKEPEIVEANKEQDEVLDGTIRFSIKITESCQMPSVRLFMVYNALSGLGEIVSATPPQDDLDNVNAGQEVTIVFATCQDKEVVLNAIKSLSEIELLDFAIPEKIEKNIAPNVCESDNKSSEPVANSASNNDAKKNIKEQSTTAVKAIQTVRVGVDRLDTLMNLVAELVIDRTRITQIENELSYKYEGEELINGLGETAAHIGRVVTELQEHIMKIRLLPVEQVFSRFPRMVRDLSHKVGKDVEFVMEGQETELDRSILEEIVDPLTHLLRNSVDHGIELPEERIKAGKPKKARVVLAAKQEENRIIIEVQDDGKGINIEKVKQAALKNGAITKEQLARLTEEDALQLIFASGVSTAEKVTDVSGRGVGMDVVRNNIQGLSGSVSVYTEAGKGSTFKISLPLTLAIIQALVTGVDDRVFVIPLSAVIETFRCRESEIRYIDGHKAINFRGSVLPLINMGSLFKSSREKSVDQSDINTFVVINTGAGNVGFVVDRLIGEQEVVIKPLGSFFGDLHGIAGATILGDGQVALIVDVAGLGALLNRRRQARGSMKLMEAS